MRFDEISGMDEDPIDEDILEGLCPLQGGILTIPDVHAMLILHYFRKYDERYGTRLTEGMEMPQLILGQDDIYEDEVVWHEEIENIMDEAIYSSGWSAAWISTETEGLEEAFEGGKGDEEIKRDFHEAYINFLDDAFREGFAKSCFMMEEDNVREAVGGLETGMVGIMWNEKLERYMSRRAAERDVVDAVCPEEDRCIDILGRKVWDPYMDAYMQDMAEYAGEEYAGRKYCRVMLGSDGYNWCWFDSVNPNWICRAIKLSRMLDLALEKLEIYEKRKEEGAA